MKRNPNDNTARRNRVRAMCKSAFYAAIVDIIWNDLFCFDLVDEHLFIQSSDSTTRRRMQDDDEEEFVIDATFEYNDNIQDFVFDTASYDKTQFGTNFQTQLCSEFGSEDMVNDAGECVAQSTSEDMVGNPTE